MITDQEFAAACRAGVEAAAHELGHTPDPWWPAKRALSDGDRERVQQNIRRQVTEQQRRWGTPQPAGLSSVEFFDQLVWLARIHLSPKRRPGPPAPVAIDRTDSTDLWLTYGELQISARVRPPSASPKHQREFILRSAAPNGEPVELREIRFEYRGDYLIHAHEDPDRPGSLGAWFIGDLSVFRTWFKSESERLADYAKFGATKPWPWGWNYEIRNRDGTAFMPFRIAALPDDFVVAHNLPYLERKAARRARTPVRARNSLWRVATCGRGRLTATAVPVVNTAATP